MLLLVSHSFLPIRANITNTLSHCSTWIHMSVASIYDTEPGEKWWAQCVALSAICFRGVLVPASYTMCHSKTDTAITSLFALLHLRWTPICRGVR
jgi:hypothetical protein